MFAEQLWRGASAFAVRLEAEVGHMARCPTDVPPHSQMDTLGRRSSIAGDATPSRSLTSAPGGSTSSTSRGSGTPPRSSGLGQVRHRSITGLDTRGEAKEWGRKVTTAPPEEKKLKMNGWTLAGGSRSDGDEG